jgi:hypothetical protein
MEPKELADIDRAIRQLRELIDAASEVPIGKIDAHLDQIGKAVALAERGLEALQQDPRQQDAA